SRTCKGIVSSYFLFSSHWDRIRGFTSRLASVCPDPPRILTKLSVGRQQKRSLQQQPNDHLTRTAKSGLSSFDSANRNGADFQAGEARVSIKSAPQSRSS